MNSKELRLLGEAYAKINESQTENIQEGEIQQQQQLSDYKRRALEAAAAEERKKEREASGMKAGPDPKPETQMNSVDLFDIVKGHLMSEGYADTEEAALAIMANMSEEWRQSIVEQSSTRSVADNVTDAFPWNRNTRYTTQGELRKPGENVHGQQTGRGLNVQTHEVRADGTNTTTPPPLRPAPLVQQNKLRTKFSRQLSNK